MSVDDDDDDVLGSTE